MRRHLERAEFDKPETSGRTVGRIQLVDADLGAMGVAGDVDQQVTEDAIDHPRRHAALGRVGDLRQRNLEFVDLFVAALVGTRRLGWSGR